MILDDFLKFVEMIIYYYWCGIPIVILRIPLWGTLNDRSLCSFINLAHQDLEGPLLLKG